MSAPAKKLTVLIEADVHRALLAQVGRGHIGKFLSDAARPLLSTRTSIPQAYAAMARDERREREAHEWSEGVLHDSYEPKEK